MMMELEKLFSPETLAALDERVRRIVSEAQSRSPGASDDDWLTVKEVSALSRFSEWQIYEAIKRGELEHAQPYKRGIRVRRSEAMRWIGRRAP